VPRGACRLSGPRSAWTLVPPATSGTAYLCGGTRPPGRHPQHGEPAAGQCGEQHRSCSNSSSSMQQQQRAKYDRTHVYGVTTSQADSCMGCRNLSSMRGHLAAGPLAWATVSSWCVFLCLCLQQLPHALSSTSWRSCTLQHRIGCSLLLLLLLQVDSQPGGLCSDGAAGRVVLREARDAGHTSQ
jgi:hypothetical protein